MSDTMTFETLFRIIGLHMAGFFGKGKRGLAKAERMHKAGILTYWAGSASACGVFKTPTIVEVR